MEGGETRAFKHYNGKQAAAAMVVSCMKVRLCCSATLLCVRRTDLVMVFEVETTRARPKSATLTVQSRSTSRLPDFKSL